MKKTIFLKDPTSFSVHDLTLNRVPRRIILIGEVHEITGCEKSRYDPKTTEFLTLSDFLQQYHKSIGKDKVLDIFSESFYIGGKRFGWLPTLHYLLYMTAHVDDARALSFLRDRLDTCSPKYNFTFYDCPEKWRIHLCDVRFLKQMDYSIKKANPMECRVDMLFKIGLSYIYPDRVPKVSRALCGLVSFVRKFLFDKKSEEYHTKLSGYILQETKIHKQLEHIPSRTVRKKLSHWSHTTYDKSITHARKKFRQFEKNYGNEIQSCLAVEYVSDNCTKAFIQLVSIQILYVISVFMDMYLTSRMLRDFVDGTHADNAVVYVGEFHAKQYRELLKLLGAKTRFSRSSLRDKQYKSCVDISRFYYTHMKKTTTP